MVIVFGFQLSKVVGKLALSAGKEKLTNACENTWNRLLMNLRKVTFCTVFCAKKCSNQYVKYTLY